MAQVVPYYVHAASLGDLPCMVASQHVVLRFNPTDTTPFGLFVQLFAHWRGVTAIGVEHLCSLVELRPIDNEKARDALNGFAPRLPDGS